MQNLNPIYLLRLVKIIADGAYGGENLLFSIWLQYRKILQVIKRNEIHKFVVLPIRWIVERTFAWLNNFRRLSKDYEHTNDSRKAFVLVAHIRLTLARVTDGTKYNWKRKVVS